MAVPAVAVGHTDPGNGFPMTPFAIGFDDFRAVLGYSNKFRDPTGVKGKDILHPGDAFPGQMIDGSVIGQVAIDAFDPAVGALMAPGLVLGLHDMAAGTEFRSFGFGVQFGRAKGG